MPHRIAGPTSQAIPKEPYFPQCHKSRPCGRATPLAFASYLPALKSSRTHWYILPHYITQPHVWPSSTPGQATHCPALPVNANLNLLTRSDIGNYPTSDSQCRGPCLTTQATINNPSKNTASISPVGTTQHSTFRVCEEEHPHTHSDTYLQSCHTYQSTS